MIDTKSPLASKGVLGSVLALLALALPTLLKLAGVDDKIAPQDVVDLISQAVAFGGAALALYGRLTAKKVIA